MAGSFGVSDSTGAMTSTDPDPSSINLNLTVAELAVLAHAAQPLRRATGRRS